MDYKIELTQNRIRYQDKGYDPTDVNLLCALDEDILREHNAALQKRNKNEDMKMNKIETQLEEKPELKDYMYTKIGKIKLEDRLFEM